MTIEIVQLKNSHDREKIYRFLYEIWSDEFCRSMEGMDHEHRLMKDGLDETARHLVAVDRSGRIAGCVRINILSRSTLPGTLEKHLKSAELVELFGSDKIAYASHFAVAPEARGRTVASLLISALYRLCLDEGATVGISYCALQFVSFYSQLGYRQYTENFRLDAGVRIPIVHCIRDWTYLNEIKSPLVRLCTKEHDDKGVTARKLAGRFPLFKAPGFSRTKVHHLWARLAHSTPGAKAADSFFYGLSVEEQKIVGRRVS
jgi:ribosomal protein S18 acetylase RimI-like enzyme